MDTVCQSPRHDVPHQPVLFDIQLLSVVNNVIVLGPWYSKVVLCCIEVKSSRFVSSMILLEVQSAQFGLCVDCYNLESNVKPLKKVM